MKIFLCNPPTGFFIRDERCQIDVESRLAENIREPIQILYLAGLLQGYGYDVFLRDYSASRLAFDDVLSDVSHFTPNFFYMETTQGTFSADLDFIRSINRHSNGFEFVIKAPFLDCAYLEDMVSKIKLNIKQKIYFITRNFEVAINNIFSKNLGNSRNTYTLLNGKIHKSENSGADDDFNMDCYASPPRYFLNKNDYTRPDTGEPIAYIYTSKGCPYDCIFCAAPVYLGKKVRTRSVESIIGEIKDCEQKYDIKDFFFRSDTFTFDKKWVMSFCRNIEQENLKIRWGTNSRADKGDKEMFDAMRHAGCDILGLGIESGSSLILKNIKKGITVNSIRHVHNLIKESGMRTFLHCIIGFPWDNCETISETRKLVLGLEPDFIEINVPYPLRGTELYDIAKKNNLFTSEDFEKYSHVKPILRTFFLRADEVSWLRKDLIRSFYFRPKYIIKKLISTKHPKVFLNYIKWGSRLIKKIYQ